MPFGKLALVAGALAALLGQAAASSGGPVQYRPLVLDGHQLKWGAPELGRRAEVSYALVAQAERFPGARNCAQIAPMQPLLQSSGVTPEAFEAELAQAFAAWESVAAISFVRGDPDSADILIGRQIDPRGRAFTNVSYDRSVETPGVRSLTRALICLNPSERWKIGFDGNLDVYDLRYTLMHEIGHAIGLNHAQVRGVLMDFRYHESFRAPQAGDAAGAVAVYGPAAATPLLAGEPSSGASERVKWGEAALQPHAVVKTGAE